MITAVAVVFISMFISVIEDCIFFMDVNSYVGNKVDLTWLLGITIDSDLKFNKHISDLCDKFSTE